MENSDYLRIFLSHPCLCQKFLDFLELCINTSAFVNSVQLKKFSPVIIQLIYAKLRAQVERPSVTNDRRIHNLEIIIHNKTIEISSRSY